MGSSGQLALLRSKLRNCSDSARRGAAASLMGRGCAWGYLGLYLGNIGLTCYVQIHIMCAVR